MCVFLQETAEIKKNISYGSFIQSHSLMSRPLIMAFESIGSYWEAISFTPLHEQFFLLKNKLENGLFETIKNVWLQFLIYSYGQVSRWIICNSIMFSYYAVLTESHRTDLITEINDWLKDKQNDELRKRFMGKLLKMFLNIPLPGFTISLANRLKKKKIFCQIKTFFRKNESDLMFERYSLLKKFLPALKKNYS